MVGSITSRVRARKKPKNFVQTNIRPFFKEIAEAVADGTSWQEIYEDLKARGVDAGRDRSSLYTAYHKLVKGGIAQSVEAQPAHVPIVVADTRRRSWED